MQIILEGLRRIEDSSAAGLRRLEDSVDRGFDTVNQQLSRMPNDYVPRREVERRLDEITVDLGAERAERIEADKAQQADAKEAKVQASNHRRALWIAVPGGLTGVGSLIVSILNLHH